jgi:hypothetical protein
MKLLQSQKNDLYDKIIEVGLSPIQFEFVQEPSRFNNFQPVTILKYYGSDFYFNFDNIGKNLQYNYNPGIEYIEVSGMASDWIEELKYFHQWLQYLKREVDAPNKWERLKQEINEIGITYEDSQDRFSALEYEDLRLQMNTLKDGVRKLELQPEQIELINSKLDHVTELAITMNKFDWKGLLVGTAVSLVMQLALTPESSKAFLELLKVMLAPVLQIP